MALPAKRPILAAVGISLLVAGKTIYRRASKAPLRMAIGTIHLLVPPHQPKGGQIMVNDRFFPTIRRVALVANHTQAALMGIILTVTTSTVDRCPLEETIRMAVLAIDLLVTAQELEGKKVMIDGDPLPILR
jgi:hypothetical protein